MRVNEKLGVPLGIEEIGKKLQKKIISTYDYIEKNEDINSIHLMNYQFTFGNYNLNLPVFINLTKDNSLNSPVIYGLGMIAVSKGVLKDKKILLKKSKKFRLDIDIAYFNEISWDEIKIVLNKSLKEEIIVHELKHLYDGLKNNIETIDDRAIYASNQGHPFPPLVSDFLYLLYYTTTIENLVRPSELYSSLKNNNITKENFKEFMENSDIMKSLNQSINFNLGDFKKGLETKEISEFLDNVYEEKERTNNIDDMIRLIYINVASKFMETSSQIIQSFIDGRMISDLVSIMVFMEPNKEDLKIANENIKRLLKRVQKYENNPEKYIEVLIKRLNFAGDKMKRKLYKLYDMVDNSKNTDKKSILNWELHNKINSKNEKIIHTLDFNKFKNIFK